MTKSRKQCINKSMQTKKIVFMGSKAIGAECLAYLAEHAEDMGGEVIGVLTNQKRDDAACITDICTKHNIPLIPSLDEYLKLPHVDILISVQYHEILKKPHIEKADQIAINLHMAPVPEYRGCNQFSFAIIDGVKEFGTTIHRLEEGIDSGDIIAEKRFPIPDDIFVMDLYDMTYKHSVTLFQEQIEAIIKGDITLTPQASFAGKRPTSIHYRNEIETIKQIDLDWPQEKIKRHVRATYFDGFEPPYTYVGDKKVYFTKEGNTI